VVTTSGRTLRSPSSDCGVQLEPIVATVWLALSVLDFA